MDLYAIMTQGWGTDRSGTQLVVVDSIGAVISDDVLSASLNEVDRLTGVLTEVNGIVGAIIDTNGLSGTVADDELKGTIED